ncbi:TetR/AcrR family transcriptional regulator [Enterococcus sp. DIV0660C]|uniref:TetR/AcrR family transcriptional regulator n=1 Tax=Enterococcus sp. DIV0660C TaxID=2230880 RepID=UPI001A903AC1|nr:TetR/AcrR family transcriptional regulator [Enterococcus sp. DIV0660C]MBO0430715.1 TetR/AcrR family transcriptional regulator C-terminal domain-containing protein [Enterococcus sp. DIV0660C]
MRNKMNEDEILGAAWKLLATEGLNNFSMRKLSQLLNIKAPSLYWYVKSKEQIFDKLASQVIREVLDEVKIADQWQQQLIFYGELLFQKLRKYPYSAYLLLRTTPNNPELLRLNNELLKIIDSQPLTYSQKFTSINAFMNYIISFEIDYLAQKENQNKRVEGEEQSLFGMASDEPIFQILQGNVLDTLGSKEAFEWGLTIFVEGLGELIKKIK